MSTSKRRLAAHQESTFPAALKKLFFWPTWSLQFSLGLDSVKSSKHNTDKYILELSLHLKHRVHPSATVLLRKGANKHKPTFFFLHKPSSEQNQHKSGNTFLKSHEQLGAVHGFGECIINILDSRIMTQMSFCRSLFKPCIHMKTCSPFIYLSFTSVMIWLFVFYNSVCFSILFNSQKDKHLILEYS